MKIIIEGRTYQAASPDDAQLSDLVALKRDTGLSKKDIRELGERVEAMSEDEAEDSEEALLSLAVMVWLTRRKAGEFLTMEQACAFPFNELQFIPEDGDEPAQPAGEAADPTRAASDPAATRPPTADRRSKTKTSKKASTSA